ncbi:hypothetical protein BGW39_010656 [Mortierella sp. 14UC]|nr:hypothetical protein BGW39_010656 [Mortierella sp. 14UC]
MLDHLQEPLCLRFNWYHAGQCLNVFPFHITNPGKLSLEITHLYDNFGVVVEQVKEWPVLQRSKVVSNLPLEVCRSCPSRVARTRFSSPLLEEDAGQEKKSTHEESSDLAGQLGKLANTNRSSLMALGMSSRSSLRNRYQAYTNGRTHANPYENLLMDENYDRLPLCSREHAVQGAWLPAHPLDKQTSRATDRLEEKHDSTTFTYLHDPLFTNNGEKADMLVANMGHWATGTKFFDQLMSTSKYHDKLQGLIDTIQQHARDLQDLQDEDDGSLGHFLDDEEDYAGEADDEDGHDYETEGEEEDEVELEKQREEKLAKGTEEKEEESEEVYWEDETEQEVVVDSPPGRTNTRQHRRPTLKELEDQQEAMDVTEDKYRVGDRHRAEAEGYISREQTFSHDPLDRTSPRYPSNRILRQSKHVKTPAKSKIVVKVPETELEEEEEDEEQQQDTPLIRNRYRYGTQKKVILDGNSKFMEAGEEVEEEVKIPVRSASMSSSSASAKKTVTKKKKKATSPKLSRPRPVSPPPAVKKPIATKAAFRGPYAYSTGRTVPLSKVSKFGNIKKSTTGTTSQKGSNNSSIKMAWVGMVAYPETQSADSFVSHDWRTTYRLRYWNLIAEDVMLLHNVRFMDFFSMTLSMPGN